MRQMNPPTLAEFLKSNTAVLIDVREAHELANGVIENSIHIPMNQIPERINELADARQESVVLICRSGKRSAQVAHYLDQAGFTDTINLEDGMNGWAAEIDPTMTIY